ncbi:MAG: hypothetical protein M3389_17240 [Actinomycetota bacterium]|nr:hypothetical protein [Actinomycetota bacterium]
MQRVRRLLKAIERRVLSAAFTPAERLQQLSPGSRAAARIATLVVLAVLALFAPPVVTAVAAVSIVLAGWAPAVTDLLVAVRPLVLPVLLVAFVGALELPAADQVLIGAIIAAVLLPWAASDWSRAVAIALEAVNAMWRAVLWLVAIVGLVVAVLVGMVVLGAPEAAGGAIETFDEFGGFALTAVALGVLVWLGALVLRLVGYGTSPGRALAAALLLSGLLVLGGEEDFVGDPWLLSAVPASLWLALSGLTMIAVIALETAGEKRFAGRWMGVRVHEGFFNAGLGAALASTFILAMALLWSAIEVRTAPEPISGARAELPAEPLSAMSDEEVIEAFMPVLSFSDEQRWLPQDAGEYARQATLKPQPRDDATVVRYLPELCPDDRPEPCYALHCPARTDPCAGTDDTLAERRGRSHDGYVYVRLTPTNDPVPPYGARVERLLQYWYFYPYDEWRAPILGGRLVQRHAADWENVTVGLGKDRPLFVAFSQHCGGRWAPWEDVIVAADPRPRTHPLVGVAVGSHANYQRAGAAQPPDWSTCQGLPGESVALLTHAWNIRDRTGTDWELLPRAWERVTASDWPMRYHGTWAHEDVTELKGLATKVLGRGAGPRSPSRQPLWTRPMRRIFCEDPWKGPRDVDC